MESSSVAYKTPRSLVNAKAQCSGSVPGIIIRRLKTGVGEFRHLSAGLGMFARDGHEVSQVYLKMLDAIINHNNR